MIRVLIVDDSPATRELLAHILRGSPDLNVVGTASDGREALQAVERMRPDVVTMDIQMPGMNGLEATRRIMATHPTPVVIVSALGGPDDIETHFASIEAGALAIVEKPPGVGHADYAAKAKELVQTVRLMSEVKVVKRWTRDAPKPPSDGQRSVSGQDGIGLAADAGRPFRVVAIGASTGGPVAIQAILSQLPADFPLPVLIVQHMAPGFVEGFVEWLDQSTSCRVQLARHGEPILPGQVYVARDGSHLGLSRDHRIVISGAAPENGLRPSVSHLFRSVAEACGKDAIGVLLTGMGKDGARELLLLKEQGAITIAQDEESSVVYGMPAEAVHLNAETHILPANRIGAVLRTLVTDRDSREKRR